LRVDQKWRQHDDARIYWWIIEMVPFASAISPRSVPGRFSLTGVCAPGEHLTQETFPVYCELGVFFAFYGRKTWGFCGKSRRTRL
jgi:hypothetical protein